VTTCLAAWLSRVMGPALLFWSIYWLSGAAVQMLLLWLWFAPLPYLAAWIAAMFGSWRTAADEGVRLLAVQSATCCIVVVLAVALLARPRGLLWAIPAAVVLAGGGVGGYLARRHARLAPDRVDRVWWLIHCIGGMLAALGVMLAQFNAFDATPGRTAGARTGWLLVPALTALGFLPHALASWAWGRRSISDEPS
jgi:hypothetical protein